MSASCSSSYFSCSNLYKSTSDFQKLPKKQKAAVIVAAIFASLLTLPLCGIGGIVVFRKAVECLKLKKIVPLPLPPTSDHDSPKSPLAALSMLPFGVVAKKDFVRQTQRLLKQKSYGKKVLNILQQHFQEDLVSEKEFNAALALLNVKSKSLRKKCVRYAKQAYFQTAKIQRDNQLLTQMALPKTQLLGLSKLCQKLNSCSKKALYINAMHLYESLNCKNKMNCLSLSEKELKQFHLTPKRKPAYFQEIFRDDGQDFLFSTEYFYDYEPLTDFSSLTEYYVDFANSFAGGNMDESFEQEEIMLAEMPNLANTFTHFLDKDARTSLAIRNGGSNRHEVLSGTPMPRIFTHALRVQQINFYRRAPFACDLHKYVQEFETPQTVHVLAMAAPKLKQRTLEEQLNLHTAHDLFNTFMAGFFLAASKSDTDEVLVHSGKIGCGVFKNNWKLVFLLQMLAAKHLNIYLYLHDCNETERMEVERLWEELLPKMQGKPLEKCIALTVSYLKKDTLS